MEESSREWHVFLFILSFPSCCFCIPWSAAAVMRPHIAVAAAAAAAAAVAVAGG